MKPNKPLVALAVVFTSLAVIFVFRSPKKNKDSGDSPEKPAGRPPASSALSRYDFAAGPRVVVLPKSLREISGLAVADDGRIFTHNDENSEVSQVDPATGNIVKRFHVGEKGMKGDFEGIAVVGARFFLVSSRGDLYEFAEGADEAVVPYEIRKTGLNVENDVEGLCYDPETQSLLLACKEKAGKDLGKSKKAVYAYSLSSGTLEPAPRLLLDLEALGRNGRGERFNPSGIEYNRSTGTFFIIAAEGWSIVEISRSGEIKGQVELDRKLHKQAEGISFMPDNSLLIADEARGADPTLSFYTSMPAPAP